MARTTAIGALLLGLSLVLLAPGAQTQDRLRLGGCPGSYITTFDFNARKISELIGGTGYQTVMALGTATEEKHTCQKLQLFDGTSFTYSFMNANGETKQVSGMYRATPTSFRTQGFLELFGLPNGVLGANIFGIAHLYPLVSRDDAHVYLSCSQLGFFHTENVYTFVPNTPAGLRGAEDVRDTLALMGIPYSKTLQKSDQTCEKPSQTTSNDTTAVDTSPGDTAATNTSSSDTSASDTSSSVVLASDASSSDALTAPASSSDASASDALSNGISAADTSSNSSLASDAPSGDTLASNASSSDALAPDASSSIASTSKASSSGALVSDAPSSPSAASDAFSSDVLPSGASLNDALASVASSIIASASDAPSSPNAASDAFSSDVLPSGASSNDALASVASSIDALASDVLSLDASSNTSPAAPSPTEDTTQSGSVEAGQQGSSSDVAEKESVTESSVDQRQES